MIYGKCVKVSKKKGFNEIKTFVLYIILKIVSDVM